MRFAIIDATGLMVGEAIAQDADHVIAPAGCTAIASDEAQIERHKWDGAAWVEIESRPSDAAVFDGAGWVDPIDINPERAAAVAAVNAASEMVRSRFVTPGSGQAMVYLEKQAEAQAWLAAGEPEDLAGYPHLAAEVGITAQTAYQLATLWLALASIWLTASARIEPVRLTACAAIEAAQTIADITAARDAALTTLGAITPATI